MFVADWMTKRVHTIAPESSISEAVRLMKERGIKHVPVLGGGKLRGIISDRDIKEFSPSKATTLDVYELHYLLAKARVKEIMKAKVITTAPDAPIEEAALLMWEKDIGCLPVVEGGRLAGIISDKDIFRALIDITGVRHGGHRVELTIRDRSGTIKEVADIIRKYNFSLQSVLTSYEHSPEGYRDIVIRTKGNGDFSALRNELMATYRDVRIKKG